MEEFFRKLKEKLFPKPDYDMEDSDELEDKKNEGEEEIENTAVSSGGPEIASAKKNKMMVIVASSLLITGVVYFLFFKTENKPKTQLEAVTPIITPREVTRSEDGKSPFELAENKATETDVALLEKPKAPDVPKLPEISADLEKEGLQDLFIKPKPPEVVPPQAPSELPQIVPAVPVAPGAQVAPAQPQQAVNQPPASDPRYAPIIVLQGQAGPALGVGYDQNIQVLNGDPIRSLEKSKVSVKTSFVEDRTNVVAQGKMLNAVLETAINTEVLGAVRAIVSRDVYGEAGNKVLIPRGARLYGTYSTETARGQSRVQINWTRLIRPDGVDLSISSFASDQFGRAGLEGKVDNKYSQVVINSLLTSILAAGGVAAAESLIGGGGSSNTTTTNPQQGTTTTTGRASSQAVYEVSRSVTDTASRFVREYFDARPAITIPQGTRITVLVNSDIKVPSVKR